MESRRQSLSNDLASRRGRAGLSISLNVGDYVIVTNSIPTTPADSATQSRAAYIVDIPPLSSDETLGIQTPGEKEADSNYMFPKVRRKSSVTFADGIQGDVQSKPSLGLIAASPVLPESEHMQSISLGRAPSQSDFA